MGIVLCFLLSASIMITAQKVILPKGLKTVPKYCFSKCEVLKEITLLLGLEGIRDCALSQSGLESIIIADGVQIIGRSAFSGCTAFVNVTIGKGIKIIGKSAFSGCASSNLTTVNIGVHKLNVDNVYIIFRTSHRTFLSTTSYRR